MYIELIDSVCKLDNPTIDNPIVKTKWFKILLLICFGPVVPLVFFIDWEKGFYENKLIFVLQILFLITSFICTIKKRIVAKIDVYNTEKMYETIDYKYYRDILKETSSGVLSFVYNKKINYVDMIVSTLMMLEKEKIIKFDYDNERLIFLSNDFDELSDYELYLVDIIKKFTENDTIQFSTLSEILLNENFKLNIIGYVKKTSMDKDYITTTNNDDTFSRISFFLPIINMFMTFYSGIKEQEFMFCMCFFNTMLLAAILFASCKTIYVRTKEGKILYDKLNGLQNFLVDYSTINERKIEEIELWDYYMIYAIIFDLKGKLDRDVNRLYRILTEE